MTIPPHPHTYPPHPFHPLVCNLYTRHVELWKNDGLMVRWIYLLLAIEENKKREKLSVWSHRQLNPAEGADFFAC